MRYISRLSENISHLTYLGPILALCPTSVAYRVAAKTFFAQLRLLQADNFHTLHLLLLYLYFKHSY